MGSFSFCWQLHCVVFWVVCFVEFSYYVHLFLFWCKCNLISVKDFLGIYVLLGNAFRLAVKRTHQFLFWLSYYKVCLSVKYFFVVSFFSLDLKVLDYDTSPSLCIRSLRGTVHSMAPFLRKFLLMVIKIIIYMYIIYM